MFQLIIEQFIMNKDQVKGEAIDIADKIQEEAGKIDWQHRTASQRTAKAG